MRVVADLVEYEFEDDVWPGGREAKALNLWCESHGGVHELALPDVERVIYALGLMLPVARQEVSDGGENHPHPECLLHVLSLANLENWYLPPVVEAVANREQAAPALPVPKLAAGGRVQTRGVALECGGCGRLVPDPARLCDDCQREFEQWKDDGAGAPVAVVGPAPSTLPPGPMLDAERRGEPREVDWPDLVKTFGPVRPCPHDTIRYEDHDGILRCAACRRPMPRAGR